MVARGKGCKPLRQRVLMALFEAGGSLHEVWASIEEMTKLSSEERADRTRQIHMDEMVGALKVGSGIK